MRKVTTLICPAVILRGFCSEEKISSKTNDCSTAVYHFELGRYWRETWLSYKLKRISWTRNDSGTAIYHFDTDSAVYYKISKNSLKRNMTLIQSFVSLKLGRISWTSNNSGTAVYHFDTDTAVCCRISKNSLKRNMTLIQPFVINSFKTEKRRKHHQNIIG